MEIGRTVDFLNLLRLMDSLMNIHKLAIVFYFPELSDFEK